MGGVRGDGGLRFNILGALEGWAQGARLRLGGVIQERVLTALLLEHGKVLPVSRLVEAAWSGEPPVTATHQVRKSVADLRRRIPGGVDVLVTDGPGYRAVVGEDQLDLARFAVLSEEAQRAATAGREAEAVEGLRAALALWRGPVLSGEGGPVIEAASAALQERRLGLAERLFGLRLALGEAAELVVDLRELIAEHPLRETLRGQLMLALYRSGRQAEALEEYGRVRELLVEELGVDPGRQLTRVYEGILREVPEMAGELLDGQLQAVTSSAAGASPGATPPGEAPSTLPYDLADFTGRDRELAELLRCAGEGAGGGTRIVALDGMGGCGKTSLAVRAAHLLADQYPDGRLHIDLHGYTPGETAVSATAALDSLLRTMGVPGDRVPEDLAGRTALWRATLVGRRLLLLVDNAADADGVLPLLPASPGCLVLVTSRARLVDLDGAEWISIDVMPPEESAELVTEMLGAKRVAAEPAAALEVARLCGHLPLALRIATARLRNRPRWTVQYLADRLRDETHRLDELTSGARSVAATLRLSYQALDDECRTAFRILALHPGGDINVHAAGALLHVPSRDAEDILELLLDVHLVQQPEIGVYTFHDLVRSFAQSLLHESAPGEDATAVERLLSYYLTATEKACEVLFPDRSRRSTGITPSTAELPDLADARRAQEWFDREQAALSLTVLLAQRRGLDRYVVCLVRNLVFQLHARGHLDEYAEMARIAVGAARRLGDLGLLGVSLSNLGVACWALGRFADGIEVAREGREVAEQLGDRYTVAHTDSTLGQFNSLLGRFPEAVEHLERAIELQRELGAARAEADSLTLLSTLYEQWGRYPQAREAARAAVKLHSRSGRYGSELVALTDLAFAHVGLGEYQDADDCLERARALCDHSQDPRNVALVLALEADVEHRLGRKAGGADSMGRALELVRSGSSALRRAKVENMAGRLRRRQGDHAAALALHTDALDAASGIEYRIEEAYALSGMADAASELGRADTAAAHRAAAEELFAVMDVPAERRRS